MYDFYESDDDSWTLVQRKRRRPKTVDREPIVSTATRRYDQKPSYAAVVRGEYPRHLQRPPANMTARQGRRDDRRMQRPYTDINAYWQDRHFHGQREQQVNRPSRNYHPYDRRQAGTTRPSSPFYDRREWQFPQQQSRRAQQWQSRTTMPRQRRQATRAPQQIRNNPNQRPQQQRQPRLAPPTHQVTSDDTDFNIKVRILHNVIKCAHHLKNITATEAPPMIHKMTDNLATFIRPSAPSDMTQMLLEGNAKNWQHTTLQILQDHYNNTMEVEIKKLTTFVSHEWRGPFLIATNWARRNLGKCLKDDTLQQAEALIVARLSDLPSADSSSSPPLPATSLPPLSSPPVAATTDITVQPLLHAPPTLRKSFSSVNNDAAPPLTTATRCSQQGTTTTAPQVVTATKLSVATMTDMQDEDWLIQLSNGEDGPSPSPCPFTYQRPVAAAPPPPASPELLTPIPAPLSPVINTVQAPPSAPKEQRQLKLHDFFLPSQNTMPPSPSSSPPPPCSLTSATHLPAKKQNEQQQNPCVVFDVDNVMSLITEEAENTPCTRNLSSSLSLQYKRSQGPPSAPEPGNSSQRTNVDQARLPASSLRTPQPTSNVQEDQHPTTTPPTSPLCRPQRHINTLRKMKDWSLHIKRKNVILGDSNLAKCPAFRDQNLQIDSYPGANFRHAAAILQRASSSIQPEVIILAFGINHRTQKARVTALKQLQAAIRMARQCFPKTHIVISLINYSCSLPKQERITLKTLNEGIAEMCDHMPKLPARSFNTGVDNIHWTPQTAAAMLEHWRAYLN